MRTTVAFLALVTLGAAGLSAQAAPSAEELVRRIQTHYDSVKDFQTDFTQSYRGGFTRALPPQRGRLLVKKPGRMYMKYEGTAKQEFWADGVRFYEYDPSTKQGRMAPLTASNETPASLTLFLGHGNLARDFTASLAAEQPPTQWRLVIVPKKPDPNAISMVLIVDRATLKLVGLEKRDSQDGTNTFTFSNLKENVGLADKEFNKTFPAGTKYDIIR